MPNKYEFTKQNPDDQIQWVSNSDAIGEWLFTYDGKTIFNMFRDYPYKLTAEQKEIFDRENPFWANFFRDRS